MADFTLRALIPQNRNLNGRLRVEKGGVVLKEINVLARGSRGPGDTQFQNNGNTPTGVYSGNRFEAPQNISQYSYGRYGQIRLEPMDGNALVAKELFGRRGLLIHGGELGGKGYWRGQGALRATHGCLRVSDSDMLALRQLLTEDHERGMSIAPTIEVIVQEN